jgi:Recombination endonuclease VII
MVALDMAQPIGPQIFRWALPVDAGIATRDGLVAYNRAVHTANRDHQRNKHLQRNYGITFAEQLRLRNMDVRAICESDFGDKAPAVDHDHDTGAVRGLLCKQCNYAMGQFGDNSRLLRRACGFS